MGWRLGAGAMSGGQLRRVGEEGAHSGKLEQNIVLGRFKKGWRWVRGTVPLFSSRIVPAVDPTLARQPAVPSFWDRLHDALRIGRARCRRFGAFGLFGGIGLAHCYDSGLTTLLSGSILDANHLGSCEDILQNPGRLVSCSPDAGLATGQLALASRK